MTHDDFETIAAYYHAASPPPVAVIRLPEQEDALDWVRDCLQKNSRDEVYGVALLGEDGEPGLTTALTGNGPTSLANAEFYMLCHTAIPALLEEVRRLRQGETAREVQP